MNELTKAWEWVPRSGIPNNLPAATLLLMHDTKRKLVRPKVSLDNSMIHWKKINVVGFESPLIQP